MKKSLMFFAAFLWTINSVSVIATMLHEAASNGYVHLMKDILEDNVDVDIRNESNETPLHHAAYFDYVACVKVLLAHGADIDAKDNKNKTPEYYASGQSLVVLKQAREEKEKEAAVAEAEEIKRFMCIQICEE